MGAELRVGHRIQGSMMSQLAIESAGVAHQSVDVPGDLLVGTAVVVGTLLCCGGIIKVDGTVENWSAAWSSAGRYRVVELA